MIKNYMIKNILFILILLLFLIKFIKKEQFDTNPCTDFLSNKDYLKHMIPHHQVAIDICIIMKNISKSVTMQNIYKKLIYNQNIEIMLMKNVVKHIPKVSNEYKSKYRNNKIITSLEMNTKSIPNKYHCDPLFFKPNDHSAHMKHMKHSDKSFLEHMIPHHQVAVVMSERLLKHTNNTHMIRLCYDIITAQRGEILQMNYLLDYLKNNNMEFIPSYY